MHKIPNRFKPRCIDCNKIVNSQKSKRSRCRQCWRLFVEKHPESHSFWKGGTTFSMGYVWKYARDHPYAKCNRVAEHRLVMEKKLGRFLKPHEHVHHIDGTRNNNHPDNLILTNKLEHIKQYHTAKGCLMCNSKKHYGRGYCHKHYERWRLLGFPKGGPLPDKPKQYCILCDGPYLAKGYCNKHYRRFRRGVL